MICLQICYCIGATLENAATLDFFHSSSVQHADGELHIQNLPSTMVTMIRAISKHKHHYIFNPIHCFTPDSFTILCINPSTIINAVESPKPSMYQPQMTDLHTRAVWVHQVSSSGWEHSILTVFMCPVACPVTIHTYCISEGGELMKT